MGTEKPLRYRHLLDPQLPLGLSLVQAGKLGVTPFPQLHRMVRKAAETEKKGTGAQYILLQGWGNGGQRDDNLTGSRRMSGW